MKIVLKRDYDGYELTEYNSEFIPRIGEYVFGQLVVGVNYIGGEKVELTVETEANCDSQKDREDPENEFMAHLRRIVARFDQKPEGWKKVGLRSLRRDGE